MGIEKRRPYGDRDSRPSFGGDRERRPAFSDRDKAPAFTGERDRKSAPKPYGYDKFKTTRTRGQEENTDSFFWLEDHKDDK
ncbi:hypothetical protein [uncultured Sphaerochaeta sp.]|uniref:hypothetical protein n=1 Tax=uncultured Sphaerochaeta sp. TaxID=886478 RepID=UPI002A0A74C9|nr:hypothetical protein [uncultured Sphaerochaeta sp.]